MTDQPDNYCEVCDDDAWIMNDLEESTEDDFPWRPCPRCNPVGKIECPFGVQEIDDGGLVTAIGIRKGGPA